MNYRKQFWAFLVCAILICVTSATALTPMGPPTSDLTKGSFDLGADYSYTKMDIQLKSGWSPGGGPDITMDNMKFNYVGARLGYGLTDTCSAYLMGGGGSARGTDSGNISYNSDRVLGEGYILGFGFKKTFFEDMNTQWGGLFQAFWVDSSGKMKAGGANWTAETDMMEVQIAAGPTHSLNDKMDIYGGPFIHLVDGDIKAKRRAGAGRIRYDLEQGGWFGGYIGTQLRVTQNASFNVEYQHTASADSIGMNMTWKF